MTNITIRSRLLLVLSLALTPVGVIAQGVPPDYGHDFVTIGAPGNRSATITEAPLWDSSILGPLGSVDYAYRISRTEVTNAQYHRFITQYVRAADLPFSPRAALGRGLFISGFEPGGTPIIEIASGLEQTPAEVTVVYAAAYANWLHNDQGTNREDFATGAYNLEQFVPDPITGQYPPQEERNEGARYFLPSLNEWTKAAHYDPNRYGHGEEGYWLYPDGGQEPLVSGFPGEPGAETSARTLVFDLFDAGAYPDTLSPWGLLDVSGGLYEATDTIGPFGVRRALVGSDVLSPLGFDDDRIDSVGALGQGDQIAIRIASIVPAPGAWSVFIIASFLYRNRKR